MENLTTEEQEYLEIVKEKQLSGLTSTQANFIKFMIKHKEEMNKIGNLDEIFKTVRNHWKGR
jgi:hypothetical protein